jgi:hypothetical protein
MIFSSPDNPLVQGNWKAKEDAISFSAEIDGKQAPKKAELARFCLRRTF